MWSRDPCDTPIIKMSIKHIMGEIMLLLSLKIIKEKMLLNKKKTKE